MLVENRDDEIYIARRSQFHEENIVCQGQTVIRGGILFVDKYSTRSKTGGLIFIKVLTGAASHLGRGILVWARSFTSLPGGNMVDGLPPVFSDEKYFARK